MVNGIGADNSTCPDDNDNSDPDSSLTHDAGATWRSQDGEAAEPCISWSQYEPGGSHTMQPTSKRVRYDGSVKEDTLEPAGLGRPTECDASQAAPPALPRYRDDPMWASLGIQVRTKEEMQADELLRRIDTNREAAIERK